MSLQFYFGPAKSGKSQRLNEELIKWSGRETNKRFLLIVPDQFSLHAQRELVKKHPRRGAMNIEVLSFGRLAYRVFTEVGKSPLLPLDDMGKSLVLRRVIADIPPTDIPIISRGLNKQGFIVEVKSMISEFMQYGINPSELDKMKEYACEKGILAAKLQELCLIYENFLAYIKDRYITTEETLDLLGSSLEKSAVIKGSVVIFDGFTGFTPLQNQVIQELMRHSEQVIVSVLMGQEILAKKSAPLLDLAEINEQSLFYLTAKMVTELCRLAAEAGVERLDDVIFERETGDGEREHLEKYLFRFPVVPFSETATPTEETPPISLCEASSLAAEVRQACLTIKELTLEKGYRYSEIAIITGDMKNYAPYLEREAKKYDIPLYLDRTSGIESNPFIEYIRAALAVIVQNYSYTSIFRFLRSGFTEIAPSEIDRLEDYVIACGIKGKKEWNEPFTRRMAKWMALQDAEQELYKINQIREKVVSALFAPEQKLETAGDIIKALYGFLVPETASMEGNAYGKLKHYEKTFIWQGDFVRAKEYGQIFRLVMELFEQIYGLLGDEKLSLEEFAEILDAGLLEIKVGTIPQNVDRIVVGDIERTRLTQTRTLFFLGINDGNIPAGVETGGLISDLDREFLQTSEWKLAPTPRQRMYNQRLYLYMIMTKPTERLYLSYARFDSEGKSLRPSYLIKTVKQLFPALPVALANESPMLENVYGMKDGLDVFVTKLRGYAAATACANEEADLSVLIDLGNIYQQNDDYRPTMEHLLEEAFKRYTPQKLTAPVANLLHGQLQNNSVSRLEKYAACAYAHFLHYGLKLREREEYSFDVADLGNVYHGVLETFAKKLDEKGLNWADAQDEECEEILQGAIDSYVQSYGETALFGSARSKQMIGRISRIMKRAEGTMRKQLRQGDFAPYAFEVAFSESDGLEAANILLGPKGDASAETMSLRGRIDRIDICDTGDKVLVKVIDYKSGQKNFDLTALYYGLQLQLAVYLAVAVEMMEKAYPDKKAIPAAALYYRVFDPLIEAKKELTDTELNDKLLDKQTMTGIVNDDAEIVACLDKHFTQKSWVIPVTKNKDGTYRKYSKVLPSDSFSLVSDYLQGKIAEMGQGIKEGDIAVSPYEYKAENGCKYCEFKKVCGFDPRLSGYKVRTMLGMKNDEALQLMDKS